MEQQSILKTYNNWMLYTKRQFKYVVGNCGLVKVSRVNILGIVTCNTSLWYKLLVKWKINEKCGLKMVNNSSDLESNFWVYREFLVEEFENKQLSFANYREDILQTIERRLSDMVPIFKELTI